MDGTALSTAAVIAAFLVPIVSLVKKDSWSDKAKQALGLGAAFVAAFAGALIDGNVHSWEEAVALMGTARLVAETLYSQYFKNTELNARLEAKGS